MKSRRTWRVKEDKGRYQRLGRAYDVVIFLKGPDPDYLINLNFHNCPLVYMSFFPKKESGTLRISWPRANQ